MEENKITWANKVTLVARPDLPPQNKVTVPDMNQVKDGLNNTIDELILVEGRVTTAEGAITTLQTDLGTAEGAIESLEKCIKLQPNNPTLFFELGKNYLSQRKYKLV